MTGRNVAYLYHNGGSQDVTMSQTFSTTYSADGIYEFSIDVGDGDYSGAGNEHYEFNIYAGNTLIGSTSGRTGDIDALETVSFASTVSDPSLNGQQIRLEIVNPAGHGGGEFIVDNIIGTVSEATGSSGGSSSGGSSGSSGSSGNTDSYGRTIPATPVAGCPNNSLYGGPESFRTGDQLDDTDLLVDVDVGGSVATQISGCSGIPGWGYFYANPSFTLTLSDMDDMEELEIETNGTSCDTVLLIRDQLGQWYFDDDGGPGLESKIKFEEDDYDMSRFNGRVDVWVGTYGGGECSLEMEIDTED